MSKIAQHTNKHFEKEMEQLKEKLLKMASLVESSIAKSVKALKERIEEPANEVISDDNQINQLEMEIDELCLDILARRQPAAVDLRFVTSSMKINNDLERMGDLAVNIAFRTLKLLKYPQLKPLTDISRMASEAQLMLKDSLDAFINRNTDLAREVCKRDDIVDDLNIQVFRELLTYMMEDNKTIKVAVNLVLVGRHLERIADLSTNISEEIVYMVEGKTIKHHVEERDLRKE